MHDLIIRQIIGNFVAHMHVIEFQKRDWPHAHILIILGSKGRSMTPECVDFAACAGFSPDPEDAHNDDEA